MTAEANSTLSPSEPQKFTYDIMHTEARVRAMLCFPIGKSLWCIRIQIIARSWNRRLPCFFFFFWATFRPGRAPSIEYLYVPREIGGSSVQPWSISLLEWHYSRFKTEACTCSYRNNLFSESKRYFPRHYYSLSPSRTRKKPIHPLSINFTLFLVTVFRWKLNRNPTALVAWVLKRHWSKSSSKNG